MIEYDIRVKNVWGTQIASLPIRYLGWSLATGDPGWFSIATRGDIDTNVLAIDNVVEIWRKRLPGNLKRVFVGFIRRPGFVTNNALRKTTLISGPSINELAWRRIVAYNANTSYTQKTDYADDMIKEIFSENIGASCADGDRTVVGFSVAADTGSGYGVDKSFSRGVVGNIANDIANMSAGYGSEIYWQIVGSVGGYELRTYYGQIGADRSVSGTQKVFGTKYGNLSNPLLTLDYSEEITVSYAGGRGVGDERDVQEIEDWDRSNRSPVGRREAFRDARNQETSDEVMDIGRQQLNEGRPFLDFSADILDTPYSRYGDDWCFGDRVLIDESGYQFTATIKAVRADLQENGRETIKAKAEAKVYL